MAAENAAGAEETGRRRREAPGGEAGGTRREPADCTRTLSAGDRLERGSLEKKGKGRGNLQKFRECNKVQGMNRVSGRAGDDKKRSWLLPRQSSIVVGGFARGVDSKVWWWLVVPLRMAARRCRRGGEGGTKLAWPSTGLVTALPCQSAPVPAPATCQVPSSSSSCLPLFVAQVDRLEGPQLPLLVRLIGHTPMEIKDE